MGSKRAKRRRGCVGKVRFTTEAAATAALVALRHSGKWDGKAMGTYRCRFCRGRHFGHVGRKAHRQVAINGVR